jgi:hypothetical protein
MPGRIAKADIKAVFVETKDRLLSEAGPDGIVSRADAKAAAEKAPTPQEAALTRLFYGFTDNRDFKAGARVTGSDLARAVDYAGPKMVDRLDVNNNGLSKAELKQGSNSLQLAAAIVQARRDAKAAAAE